MNKLPFFDPYPFQEEDRRDEFEQRLGLFPEVMSGRTAPRAPLVAGCAEDFLMHAIAGNGACGGLPNQLEWVLEDTLEYDQWINRMPVISADSPFCRYKNDTCRAAVEATHGALQDCPALSGGQVLFHGGMWCSGNDSLTTDRALSLSLSAAVAVCETRHDLEKEVWLITVSPACVTPVFVYEGRPSRTVLDELDPLKHELEVLVRAGARFERHGSESVLSRDGNTEYRVHYVTMC
ncbi:hypothetical protein [Pseudomonas sp. PH1b]|uniref:hypothetical protein n=1 Tax=Pseudomonas sp. PH1b TaxID=1397282 RepID=UPI000469CA92|nr:hypothetical protein [Pseudomonas sp. PH1b]